MQSLRCVDSRAVVPHMNGIFSITNQRAFVTLEVAEFEEVAPSCGGAMHEVLGELVEPNETVEEDNKD